MNDDFKDFFFNNLDFVRQYNMVEDEISMFFV